MRRSFKRAFSLVLALLMLTLAIPSGLTVTAADATSETVTVTPVSNALKASSNSVSESNADFVYIVDGIGANPNTTSRETGKKTQKGTWASLHDAIGEARVINKGTHYFKVTAETLTEPAYTYDGLTIDITVDGFINENKNATIVYGSVSNASALYISNFGKKITFRNLNIDASGLKKKDGSSCSFISLRVNKGYSASTLTFDNCKIVHPKTSATFLQGSIENDGKYAFIDCTFVSSLNGAAATQPLYSSVASKNREVYIRNCDITTSAANVLELKGNELVEIVNSTLTTTATGAATVIKNTGSANVTVTNSELLVPNTTNTASACISNEKTMALAVYGNKTYFNVAKGSATIVTKDGATTSAVVYDGRFVANESACKAVTLMASDIKNTKNELDRYTDAITEENADHVFVVDGIGEEKDHFHSVKDVISYLWSIGASTKETYFVKVVTSVVDKYNLRKNASNASIEGAGTCNWNITFDGSYATGNSRPIVDLGNGATQSAWLFVGAGAKLTFKNLVIDGTRGERGTKAGANRDTAVAVFANCGGTLALDNCTVVQPSNGSAVFQTRQDEYGTYVCVDTDVRSALTTNTATISIMNFNTAPQKGSSNKRNILLEDCRFVTTNTYAVCCYPSSGAVPTHIEVYGGEYKATSGAIYVRNGNDRIDIYDGVFATTAANVSTIRLNGANGKMNIYDGEFDASGAGSITIGTFGSNDKSNKPADDTTDVHPSVISNTKFDTYANIYGGSFSNSCASGNQSFVVRSAQTSAIYIYGGMFVSKYGTVIGAGESGSTGFLYVYGGTFLKTATDGHNLVQNNYAAGANNWAAKYYYLYGGTYYTAKTADDKAYRSVDNAGGKTTYNRAAEYVTYTDIDKVYNETTYADAVTITAKLSEGIKIADDLFGNMYQQISSNTTAGSATADLRLVVEVKDSELERLYDLGFWVSIDNATAIDRAELNETADKITDKGHIHNVYKGINQVVGSNAAIFNVREGYSFVVLEIKGIDNADFNKNIYFRAYGREVNEKTGETTIHYSDVKTAGVYKSLG